MHAQLPGLHFRAAVDPLQHNPIQGGLGWDSRMVPQHGCGCLPSGAVPKLAATVIDNSHRLRIVATS